MSYNGNNGILLQEGVDNTFISRNSISHNDSYELFIDEDVFDSSITWNDFIGNNPRWAYFRDKILSNS